MNLENDINFDDMDLTISDGGFDFEMDLEGFDVDSSLIAENRYHLPKLHKKIKKRVVTYDNAVKMIDEVGEHIKDGETVYALLSGNFIFGDLIEALAVKYDILYEDVTISTLSISRENVDSLQNLLTGDYCKSLNLIVSDYFWSHNRQNGPYIYKALDTNDCFQLAVAGIHTKITLLKTEGGKKIVITGSANLRSSRSLEEITIQTNPELYDFHKQWHDEILRDYGTIQKTKRASVLFDLITKNAKGKEW